MRMPRAERESQIIHAARAICAEKGFAGSTLDDIAREAGISRQLIIQYFGSKDGLYDAMFEPAQVSYQLEKDEALLQAMEDGDDEGVLRACASYAFEHLRTWGRRSAFRLRAFGMLEKADIFTRVENSWTGSWDVVVRYLQARQESGHLRAIDAHHVVDGFRRMLTELLFELMDVDEETAPGEFDEAVDAMIDVMLTGLRS
jgi:AcrR family transcriptional regulator